jgi:hypothetical protein
MGPPVSSAVKSRILPLRAESVTRSAVSPSWNRTGSTCLRNPMDLGGHWAGVVFATGLHRLGALAFMLGASRPCISQFN